MRKILFICTGNTCRSSMAEGILKSEIARDTLLSEQYITASAGISAFEGDYASKNAIKVLRDEWNIDIKSHLSRQITRSEINDAYLIFTMTRSHKSALISMYPDAKSKIYTLKEYVNYLSEKTSSDEYFNSLDISDPYGMDVSVYKQCALEIQGAISKLVEKLKEGNV